MVPFWKATSAGLATGTTTTALHRFWLRSQRVWHSASASLAVSPLPLVRPGGGMTKHVPPERGKQSVREPTNGSNSSYWQWSVRLHVTSSASRTS